MTDVKKICARLAVVSMVAVGASACSSIPDWVDPTTWVGGGDNSQTAVPDPDADAQAGESPDLAAIPDRPTPSSTPAQQQQVASSLQSDRADAKYSADALRGGTEPVAAPPPPASAPEPEAKTAEAAPPPPPAAAPSATDTAAPAPQTNADINTVNGDINTSPDAGTAAPSPPPAATQLPPAQPSPQISSAQTSSPPPPPQSGMPTMAQINPSDAALGFKPSSAPPLDPSIGQFVPQPIIARYDQTASGAGMSQPRIASRIASSEPVVPRHKSAKAMGGPEMSGSVVANLDAINSAPQDAVQASAYSNPQGLPPASVVFFPGDGTLLSADGRAHVRAAVEEFKQRGGNGYIRIVGHSSSRTSNMPVEKHLEVIFNKSQDRANAVAKEVIAEGVPANRVLVEAVGDSQPVYYESMPKGEDGNRRAEIFLQS